MDGPARSKKRRGHLPCHDVLVQHPVGFAVWIWIWIWFLRGTAQSSTLALGHVCYVFLKSSGQGRGRGASCREVAVAGPSGPVDRRPQTTDHHRQDATNRPKSSTWKRRRRRGICRGGCFDMGDMPTPDAASAQRPPLYQVAGRGPDFANRHVPLRYAVRATWGPSLGSKNQTWASCRALRERHASNCPNINSSLDGHQLGTLARTRIFISHRGVQAGANWKRNMRIPLRRRV